MPEYRRILLDGAAVQVRREGEDLVAGDGRRVAADDAVHLPPVTPTKIIAVHLNHRSRVAEFGATLPPAPDLLPQARLGAGRARRRRGQAGQLPVPQLRGRGRDRDRPDLPGRAAVAGRGLHRRVHHRQRLRAARLPRHRRRVDAAGQGLGHDGAARPGPGHRLGLPRQAAAHLRQRRLAQDGSTDEMQWDMHYLVADIARTITLYPGDVLLSGTPANSRPVQPGDVVEVEVDGLGRLANHIVAGPAGVAGGVRRPADRERGGHLHRARRRLGVPRHPAADPGLRAGPHGSAGLAEPRGVTAIADWEAGFPPFERHPSLEVSDERFAAAFADLRRAAARATTRTSTPPTRGRC